MTAALLRLIQARLDPRPLAATRIALAAAGLLKSAHLALLMPALAAPAAIRLPHPWSPLPEIGSALAWGVPTVAAAAAVALALGWHARVAALALAGALATALAADRQIYGNHLWLLVCLTALLALTDCGAARSLDARRRGAARPVAAWPVRLLQTQLTVVYAFAAVTKLHPEFLSGKVLAANLRASGSPLGAAADRAPGALAVLALAIVAAEAFLAVALWVPALRRAAFGLGIALHVAILAAMELALPLAIFGLTAVAVYPLFSSRSVGARSAPA